MHKESLQVKCPIRFVPEFYKEGRREFYGNMTDLMSKQGVRKQHSGKDYRDIVHSRPR